MNDRLIREEFTEEILKIIGVNFSVLDIMEKLQNSKLSARDIETTDIKTSNIFFSSLDGESWGVCAHEIYRYLLIRFLKNYWKTAKQSVDEIQYRLGQITNSSIVNSLFSSEESLQISNIYRNKIEEIKKVTKIINLLTDPERLLKDGENSKVSSRLAYFFDYYLNINKLNTAEDYIFALTYQVLMMHVGNPYEDIRKELTTILNEFGVVITKDKFRRSSEKGKETGVKLFNQGMGNDIFILNHSPLKSELPALVKIGRKVSTYRQEPKPLQVQELSRFTLKGSPLDGINFKSNEKMYLSKEQCVFISSMGGHDFSLAGVDIFSFDYQKTRKKYRDRIGVKKKYRKRGDV